jgi:predicted nucleic acid-binding Zn ribbon protein
MPVYEFRCPICESVTEQLLARGDTGPRPCTTDDCPGTQNLKLSRVAVRYQSFGFTSTDSLVSNPEGKNFRSLQDKAHEISEN